MDLSEFTVGRVVYMSADSPTYDAHGGRPGHVHGFTVNGLGEVVIVVQFPMARGVSGMSQQSFAYYYRDIHPAFLRFAPVTVA